MRHLLFLIALVTVLSACNNKDKVEPTYSLTVKINDTGNTVQTKKDTYVVYMFTSESDAQYRKNEKQALLTNSTGEAMFKNLTKGKFYFFVETIDNTETLFGVIPSVDVNSNNNLTIDLPN